MWSYLPHARNSLLTLFPYFMYHSNASQSPPLLHNLSPSISSFLVCLYFSYGLESHLYECLYFFIRGTMRRRALSVFLLPVIPMELNVASHTKQLTMFQQCYDLTETRLGPLTPRVQKFSVGSCPVHINILNGIPDFYPSDASCSPQVVTIPKAPETAKYPRVCEITTVENLLQYISIFYESL